MASEIAINDPKAFTEMVNVAKKALEAKKAGKEYVVKTTKTTSKPVAKKETKEVAADISKLTVAELKKIAADKNITIPAGAKKADILELLKKSY